MASSDDASLLKELPPDALCASCGEFVGPARQCPHCGAVSRKRMSLVLARWLAVAVALLGLIALYLYTQNREVQTIRVEDLRPTMNFAYLRVDGRVTRSPNVSRGPDGPEYINFEVDDGTGVIRVSAYRQVVRRLEERDLIPRAGERVTAAGSIQYTGEDARMLLQVPEHLERFPVEVPLVPLAEIDKAAMGRTVRTRGTVTGVRAPGPGSRAPYRVEIREGRTTLPVVFWEDVFNGIADPDALEPGAVLEVAAAVQEYRGAVQLQLERAGDLRVVGRDAPPRAELPPEVDDAVRAVPIADVTSDQVGQRVRVEGTVADYRPASSESRTPTRVRLTDPNDAAIEIVYWGEVSSRLHGDDEPRQGARFVFTGTVGEFNNRLQLRVGEDDPVTALGDAVAVVDEAEPAPRAELPPAVDDTVRALPIADVTSDQVGQRVRVEGTVVDYQPAPTESRTPTRVQLADSNDVAIQVVYWGEVSSRLYGEDEPRRGARFAFTGTVGEFNNRLQLRVGEDDPVSTLGDAAAIVDEPGPAPRAASGGAVEPIAAVTADRAGQQAVVEGEVTFVREVNGGRLLGIRDDTGSMTLPLWDRTFPGGFPDLATGAVVRVSGKVGVYRENAQVVPEDADGITEQTTNP